MLTSRMRSNGFANLFEFRRQRQPIEPNPITARCKSAEAEFNWKESMTYAGVNSLHRRQCCGLKDSAGMSSVVVKCVTSMHLSRTNSPNIRRIVRKFEGTDGAEIAEAALVLPLVFMLLLGVIWFGRPSLRAADLAFRVPCGCQQSDCGRKRCNGQRFAGHGAGI